MRTQRLLGLVAVLPLVSSLLFGTTGVASAAPARQAYNLEYSFIGPPAESPSRATRLWDEDRCDMEPTTRHGALTTVNRNGRPYLKLIMGRGDRFVQGHYVYQTQSGRDRVRYEWAGKTMLPLYRGNGNRNSRELLYLSQVIVTGVVPNHPMTPAGWPEQVSGC